MNRPDLAGVLAGHSDITYDSAMHGWSCECGWPSDGIRHTEAEYRAHLAAVLNAAVDAWLADEETREVVARAILADDFERGYAAHEWDDEDDNEWLIGNARAALAALTQREEGQ